jgi:hypothetical protein
MFCRRISFIRLAWRLEVAVARFGLRMSLHGGILLLFVPKIILRLKINARGRLYESMGVRTGHRRGAEFGTIFWRELAANYCA